ncbi:MAG: peptidase M23 [Microgenomates group bacterium GW2011_GWC1_49_7]|nr:MAG: peptidase M23 [Microgenomates group bacterium GW2011_GWC1_49_7]
MKLLRIVLAFCLLFLAVPSDVYADEVQDRINEYTSKIEELQGQENTLANQIKLLDSQISLTTLRINTIRGQIDKLSTEITELNDEIDRLEELKTKRLELVLHRIPETYKRSRAPQFGLLFFSNNFSDFIARLQYLRTVEAEDALNYRKLQDTQDQYNERKTLREKKKEQSEALKKQLEKESAALAQKKREKQVLLEETRNSESVYQRLLAQALAEKQALERALVDAVKVGPINKGDPIALVGNSGYPGCSTGAHLHFEVRKNNAWVDPAGYLSGKTVFDEQTNSNWSVGGGSWDWPLTDPIRLTQRFGHTPWSYRYSYSGGIHTGFDMTSGSSVIRAPQSGTLYSSSQTCGGSSIIKIKYIDHGDGVLSFYLHVQ